MEKTGKLPNNGNIQIENKEDAWGLLKKGILTKVEHSGLVKYTEETKAKMPIVITKAFDSSQMISTSEFFGSRTNFDQKESNGLSNAKIFAIDYFCKNAWYLFGYINNTVPKKICVIYFIEIKLAFYSILKEDDDTQKFFNPHLN